MMMMTRLAATKLPTPPTPTPPSPAHYCQGRNRVYGLRAQSPKYDWDQGSEERAQGSEEWDQGSQRF